MAAYVFANDEVKTMRVIDASGLQGRAQKSKKGKRFWTMDVECGDGDTLWCSPELKEALLDAEVSDLDVITVYSERENGEWIYSIGKGDEENVEKFSGKRSGGGGGRKSYGGHGGGGGGGGGSTDQEAWTRFQGVVAEELFQMSFDLHASTMGEKSVDPDAVQATFATMVITWRDMGNPKTNAEMMSD